MSVPHAPTTLADANDDRIGIILGELTAYGAGWITLMGGEVRAYREELEERIQLARAGGCTGQHCHHDHGCHGCYVMRERAARTAREAVSG